jgi:5-methylcytosine-specific restriction endonuclease McrA
VSRTSTKQWRQVAAEVRRNGRALGAACALCGGARGPIDYRTQAEADREARANGEWWLIGAPRPLALHVDHIVPYVAGGQDVLGNAACSHAACNISAGAKGARRAKRASRAVVSTGEWRPLSGVGDALPGRGIAGQRTATHVFVVVAQ